MNGAESLLRTFAEAGVELCFANPGTTELPLVAAFDAVPTLRPVPALFEGVCSGAADGYARIARRPALTLLHHGAGLGNALANLHNARRARSPLINLVGDHAPAHAAAGPPLATDVEGLARPMSGWLRTAASSSSLAADGAQALLAARSPPGQVATLVIPGSCAWGAARGPAVVGQPPAAAAVDPAMITAIAAVLRRKRPAALLLDTAGLEPPGLAAAGRISVLTGAALLCPTFPARLARGAGRLLVERLPYLSQAARARLGGLEHLILAGSEPPVAFFTDPGDAGRHSRGALLPARCALHSLAASGADVVGTLEALAEALGARTPAQPVAAAEVAPPSGRLRAAAIGAAVASTLPAGAIVVDESGTAGPALWAATARAPAHDWLCLTGGALGQGLPLAVGAALAAPHRRVLCLLADGAAAYTPQALWTLAHEQLDVTVVVLANRAYRLLQRELQRLGLPEGAASRALLEQTRPSVDWCRLAASMGVAARCVATAEALVEQLRRDLCARGPCCIEARFKDP